MTTEANRVNAGVPTGGQFAAHDRAEGDVDLVASFRASQVREAQLSLHNNRLATKILAQTLLAERPDAAYFSVSEGEEGDYWNSEGVLLDADKNVIVEWTGELDCGDRLFEFIDLPFRKPRDPGGDGEPAPGFDWLELTEQTDKDYAEATIDLRLAAEQDIS